MDAVQATARACCRSRRRVLPATAHGCTERWTAEVMVGVGATPNIHSRHNPGAWVALHLLLLGFLAHVGELSQFTCPDSTVTPPSVTVRS